MVEPRIAERHISVMGTRGHVLVESAVVDPASLVRHAIDRLDDLERRWSRFIPTSEISRWNHRRGEPFEPTGDTWRLIRTAADACERTGGRFDPTLLDRLCALGYDRPFDPVAFNTASRAEPSEADVAERAERSVAHGHAISFDPCDGTVCSTRGFDPGGIGKGFAADLVVGELIARGATRATVNIGGDLRTGHALEGRASMTTPIDVAIGEPFDGGSLDEIIRIDHGAIATSTTQRRRWLRAGTATHHIVDPRTCDAAVSGAVVATVIAAEAWWAEAVATALIVDPTFVPDRACALVVFADGDRRTIGEFDDYRVASAVPSGPRR